MLEARVVRAYATNYPYLFNAVNKYFFAEMKPYMIGEVQRRCPRDKGTLINSINGKVRDDQLSIGTNVEYAPHVEYGTKPHIITVKSAKVLTNGKSFFGKTVQHPGTAAQPFMRTALDDNRRHLVTRWRQLFRKTFRTAGKL
jgi:phage gpG-like protein